MFSSEPAKQAFADEQEIISTGRAMLGKEEEEPWPDGRDWPYRENSSCSIGKDDLTLKANGHWIELRNRNRFVAQSMLPFSEG